MAIIDFISNNLLTIMPAILIIALGFRYAAYTAGKSNQGYFTAFSNSAEKLLNREDKFEKIDDVDGWLNQFLHAIVKDLPSRSVRNQDIAGGGTFRLKDKESMEEFSDGRRSIINALKQQVEVFKSAHQPNFSELTQRILDQDRKWNFLMGFFPMSTLSRMLDLLPGLFVIGGIFGTFVGITSALPIIATIDLSNLDEATPKLMDFVKYVAYSMNTSIAGIICSVIMMILNAMFPIDGARHDVRKNLERCFEFMWYRIHGNQLSQGEFQIVEALKRLQVSLVDGKKSSMSRSSSKASPLKKSA